MRIAASLTVACVFVIPIARGQENLSGPPAAESPVAEQPTPEGMAFFEKNIRPLLVNHCYECHSAESEELQGELLLDTRAGIRRGGELGPAIVPGTAESSLLIAALRHKDGLEMPPESKLSESQISLFEQWINMGAPDPRDGEAEIVPTQIDIQGGRKHWAYQPLMKAEPPVISPATLGFAPDSMLSPIDRFVLAKLSDQNLKQVGPAEPRVLVRRVYFDLIGLPPTPTEVDAFVAECGSTSEQTQAALSVLVDRLLASRQYGERWGRYWLDVARYSETSGGINFNYPNAWRYRDYVIDSFNKDKSFAEFLSQQIAGDLLPADDEQELAENLIGTGFLALGIKLFNEMDPEKFKLDLIDEQIDTTMTAFLGQTAACARCHDHKFDPIPTEDYYALAGIFLSSETCYGTVNNRYQANLIPLPDGVACPDEPPLTPSERADFEQRMKLALQAEADWDAELAAVAAAGKRINPRRAFANRNIRYPAKFFKAKLDHYAPDGRPIPWALGAREADVIQDSPVYVRGEPNKPSKTVPRGFLSVIDAHIPEPPHVAQASLDDGEVTGDGPQVLTGSGRRELAQWMLSPDNPLTSRVYVNRVWSHLFGRGLVATVDNFGTTGEPPSNQSLLDYLAVSFPEQGWSTKQLIREIVLSHTYQLASTYDGANYEIDPDNSYLWRMSPRQLDAEAHRDAILSVAGTIDLAPAVASPLFEMGEGVTLDRSKLPKDGRRRPGVRPQPDFDKGTKRSVYLPVLRSALPKSLSLFNFPEPNSVIGDREESNVPSQALFLMNHPFVQQHADEFAQRVLTTEEDDKYRLELAYRLAYSRLPSSDEGQLAEDFLKRYATALAERNDENPELHSWSALCQALLASAEFRVIN